MRLYYLVPRGKRGIIYVAFVNPDHSVGNKKSTGTSDPKLAEEIAQSWLINGIPGEERQSSESLVDFLTSFWDFDKSPYFRERLTMGKSCHRRHAIDMQNNVRRYIAPYFKKKRLKDLNEEAVQAFLVHLKIDRGLAASTVNQARNAIIVALGYAKRKKLIRKFDFDAVLRAGGTSKERGILEKAEVVALFRSQWRDERSRLVTLIASQTGMRLGEIRALQIRSILFDRILVDRSWSHLDGGMKSTKNSSTRIIPIMESLRIEIQNFIDIFVPRNTPESLLFEGSKPGVPLDDRQIVQDFYSALKNLGIDEKVRKMRNIVFHSLRHYCAKNLALVTSRSVGMAILGHKTGVMFDHYSQHVSEDTFLRMEEAISSGLG